MDALTGNAIQEINKLNEKSHEFTWIGNHKGGKIILDRDGKVIHEVDPYEHNQSCTVDGFCSMVKNQWTRRGKPKESVTTIDNKSLQFKLEPTAKIHESHRCTLALAVTTQFKALLAIQGTNGKLMSNGELDRWLRKNFPDSQMFTEAMPTLRNLKFSTNSESNQKTRHAHDEMSNSAKRSAHGTEGAPIPEFAVLTVPIWQQAPDITVDIRCAIDVDFDTQKIDICPVAGAIEQATIDGIGMIYTQVTSILPLEISIISNAHLDHTQV